MPLHLRPRHILLAVTITGLVGCFVYHPPETCFSDPGSFNSSIPTPTSISLPKDAVGINVSSETPHPSPVTVLPSCPPPAVSLNPFDPLNFVRGKPTASFRDNLRPNLRYMTVWLSGGITNDVMATANMIYAARLAGRIPVLAPMYGYQNEWYGGFIPFGDMFDMPGLRKALNMPILEWKDVKDSIKGRQQPAEPLGCWSLWAPYGDGRKAPRENNMTVDELFLDIGYTPIMEEVKLWGMDQPDEMHVSLNKVGMLGHDELWDEAVKNNEPVAYVDHLLDNPNLYSPDRHMMCMDFIYFAATVMPHEWRTDYWPTWGIIKHLRWTPKLEGHGKDYVRRLFKLSATEAIPPFITIHARRRDFSGWCDEDKPLIECFAPLKAYAVRVQEIQDELRAKLKLKDKTPLNVIMTSDENDPKWWAKVKKRGWWVIDHGPEGENTAKKIGAWAEPLVEIVIHSLSTGFVGTAESTMSHVSRRRVEEWNGGVGRTVQWGFPGADDH